MHNDKFIMDFKEKAELFNEFFTKQCPLINNDSELSTSFLTVEFLTYDLLKIILKNRYRYINPNKAHGQDMISIRMLKLVSGKIFERFLYGSTFKFFRKDGLALSQVTLALTSFCR